MASGSEDHATDDVNCDAQNRSDLLTAIDERQTVVTAPDSAIRAGDDRKSRHVL